MWVELEVRQTQTHPRLLVVLLVVLGLGHGCVAVGLLRVWHCGTCRTFLSCKPTHEMYANALTKVENLSAFEEFVKFTMNL